MLLMCLIVGSCKSLTTYRPAIYGHDYVSREIITPVSHNRISCGDKEFNKYVSFSLTDLTKIGVLLKNAKLSRKVRIILEKFDKDIKKKIKKNKADDI